MTYPKSPIGPRIIRGRTYRYLLDHPPGCKDGVYRVEQFILDVPSYQEKVLVHCIEGKDCGLWFCCTPMNFVQRYAILPLENEQTSTVPIADAIAVTASVVEMGRALDMTEKGKGF